MNRRRFLGGCLAAMGSTAGCTSQGGDDDPGDGTPGSGGTPTDDGTPTPDGPLPLGEWAAVSDRTATRPTDVRTAERVVFRHPYDDDTVWEPTEGDQFLLVEVQRRIVEAPGDELVPYPDAYRYRVRAADSTHEPRPSPDETNVLAEPIEGGYAVAGGSSKGAAGSSTTNWLGFEVPGDVAASDVEIRYVREGGDDPVWRSDDG